MYKTPVRMGSFSHYTESTLMSCWRILVVLCAVRMSLKGSGRDLVVEATASASAAAAASGAAGRDTSAGRQLGKRNVARIDGDIIIGALFPVHRQPSLKTAFTRQCGEFWEQYGMHRIEIFLRTLDDINRNPDLLPNITLGCDIRDSCWYSPVALEQSIDFIKNSIASMEHQSQQLLANRTAKDQQPQCREATRNKPIAGLIGPGSSTVTIQVQNLLSLFNIPQIGYSSTSKDLSDKSLYKYFLRVVPSDMLQARALVDLVQYYNWTYISTVYTEGNYGFRGIQEFTRLAGDVGICSAKEEKVENNAEDEAYDAVIDSLRDTPSARVVVCFCEGMTVRKLLMATKRKEVEGHFLFIGSDGWGVRPDVVKGNEKPAVGGMSFKLYSPLIEDFNDYYFSLRPDVNKRNPWFKEFWQEKFECYFPGPERDRRFDTECTGNEDLRTGYAQDSKLGFVINAIYTMAYALDSMQQALCRPRTGLCPAMMPINGTVFLEYLLNVTFKSYSNDAILFNENGDPPGRYDIMNFQTVGSDNGSLLYDYVRIGGWDTGNLTMNDHAIFWPNVHQLADASMVESYCSRPCPKGQVKKLQQGGVQCCWVCTPCDKNEFMLDEATCQACAMGWWPDDNLTACLMIEIEHIQWGDNEALVAMAFACVGIFATMWVMLVFVRHNNTAVVKASTRELSYIILIGIGISYATTFPVVAKPDLVTCYMTRILPGFSFSLIYGALVTKTNRIARILAGSKKKIMTRKPRFMSASAQVVITFILIGVECAIITVMLILEPADSKLIYPEKIRVKLTCNASTMGIIVPLGFDIFLIVLCTLYAIKTRNLPENFNEAKFIGFTMYTTCIIWLAFVPIYFGSDSKVITMCLAITLSASVALVLLFFPKIYIIICKPERNNRSAFTTSKDVRCHIGTSGRSLSNSDGSFDRQDKTFENAAVSMYRQKNFFNRWKNKSGMQPPSNAAPQRAVISSRPHHAGGGRMASVLALGHRSGNNAHAHAHVHAREQISSSNIDVTSDHPGGPEEGVSLDKGRDVSPQTRRYKTNAATSRANHEAGGGEKRPASVKSRTKSRLESADREVQTDEELLEPLLCSLRRRRVSKTGDSTTNNASAHKDGDSQPASRKSSKASASSPLGSGERIIYPTVGASSDLHSIENELILPGNYRGGGQGSRNGRSNGGYSMCVGEHSPLLGTSEHSPLLSSRDELLLGDESTSEETLSDRDMMEDLDDLLSGVGQLQGSFNSLNGAPSFSSAGGVHQPSVLPPPINPTRNGNASPKESVCMDIAVIPEHLRLFSRPSKSVLLNSRARAPDDSGGGGGHGVVGGGGNGVEGQSARSGGQAAVKPRVPADFLSSSALLQPCSSSDGVKVPEIFVETASPSSNDRSPALSGPSIDSGRPSGGSPSWELGSVAGGGLRCSRDTPSWDTGIEGGGSRRASTTTSSSGSIGSEHILTGSPGSGSLTGLDQLQKEPDSDSIAKFQEYLRTRGLDLDLTTVQSSDV